MFVYPLKWIKQIYHLSKYDYILGCVLLFIVHIACLFKLTYWGLYESIAYYFFFFFLVSASKHRTLVHFVYIVLLLCTVHVHHI